MSFMIRSDNLREVAKVFRAAASASAHVSDGLSMTPSMRRIKIKINKNTSNNKNKIN